MLQSNQSFFPNTTLPLIVTPAGEGSSFEGLCEHYRTRKDSIIESLYKYGAILFRNFDVTSPQQLQQFMELVSGELLNYSGGDSPRDKVDGEVYTSTSFPAEYELPLHQEMSYSSRFPTLIAFFCQVEPQIGGATPLLDARELYRNLPKGLIERFEQRKLSYIQNLSDGPGMGKSWQETFETSDRTAVTSRLETLGANYEWKECGGLRVTETVNPVLTHPVSDEKIFFSQAEQWHYSSLDKDTRESLLELMPVDEFYHNCTYGDGSSISEEDLETIRDLHSALKQRFSWEGGDLLLVDNLSVMHGREPFEGDRKILVAMS